jgi:hypothetical protein
MVRSAKRVRQDAALVASEAEPYPLHWAGKKTRLASVLWAVPRRGGASMSDPKQAVDQDDLQLEPETIADLELRDEDADDIRAGQARCKDIYQTMTNP